MIVSLSRKGSKAMGKLKVTAASAFPIVGFVGANGGGKTLAMVETLALPAIEKGLPIAANFGLHYERFVPLRSWGDFLDFKRTTDPGLILLDEVSSWVPSREAQKLPAVILAELNQLRKHRKQLGWAGPAWGRCDKGLREVTQAVCWCKGFLGDVWEREPGQYRFPRSGKRVRSIIGDPSVRGSKKGAHLRVEGWPNRRLFQWRWYDPMDLPSESIDGQALNSPPSDVKAKDARLYWRPGGRAQFVYDSTEPVLALAHFDDSGACVKCGGQRRRLECGCHDYHEEKQASRGKGRGR